MKTTELLSVKWEKPTCKQVIVIMLEQGRQTFSVKSQIVNILGFMSQIESVSATQLCPYNAKMAIGNTFINDCGYVPIKRSLYKNSQLVRFGSQSVVC